MQSLALLGAVHNPCQRREMTVSTNRGLVNGPVHNLLMQFFSVGSSKTEVFETCFYDIMTTQYDHPRYVKHVLARIYIVYTPFIPYFVCALLGVDSLRGGLAEGNRITSQRLLDQSQAGVYMGKMPHTPPFWPFWGYSRTLPQGVESLV